MHLEVLGQAGELIVNQCARLHFIETVYIHPREVWAWVGQPTQLDVMLKNIRFATCGRERDVGTSTRELINLNNKGGNVGFTTIRPHLSTGQILVIISRCVCRVENSHVEASATLL